MSAGSFPASCSMAHKPNDALPFSGNMEPTQKEGVDR